MDRMTSKYRRTSGEPKRRRHPFRAAVLRGLGVLAPPLFTVLIFFWVLNATYVYVLKPVTAGVREAVVGVVADIRKDLPLSDPATQTAVADGRVYHRVTNGTFVPEVVYDRVEANPGKAMPNTAKGVYRRYVELTYLRPYYSVPFFLAVFVMLLYLFGKFIAAGVGRFFWNLFERGIHQLPLVRNVYSSVKQISDFLFSEREIEFTRVVAIEYPRKGIWSLGFVTGDSMLDIRSVANEPVLSVLIPTSPMPVTGYTVTVTKSETVDLDITVDQALQFVISCGVVIPPQQLQELRQSAPKALPQPTANSQ